MWSSPGACNKKRKSMEEVWKDISFASLQDHTAAAANRQPSFRGMIFQDFLGRPLNKEQPPPPPRGGGSSTEPSSAEDGSIFGSPATVLSLNNSGPDFQYLESSDPMRPNSQLHSSHDHHHSAISSINSPFDALAAASSSSSLFPSFCKKRGPENDDHSRDHRHKRMMKNRESAARSRARKQAYTNELELEITHLMEENARLRRQLDKFLAAPSQLPKKSSLSRASTAPF